MAAIVRCTISNPISTYTRARTIAASKTWSWSASSMVLAWGPGLGGEGTPPYLVYHAAVKGSPHNTTREQHNAGRKFSADVKGGGSGTAPRTAQALSFV
jgi:hypothetical protein